MSEPGIVATRGFHTLAWRDGRLELLDQRVLPARCEYVALDSAAGVAEAIRFMVVRGAPAIGCAAAYGIALEAQRLSAGHAGDFHAGLERAFDVLARSRPTAANLFWALDRMRRALAGHPDADNRSISARLLEEAHAITAEDLRINREIGRHGSALLCSGARVMTHCNAGALATAGHGTALGVIRSAIAGGKTIRVIAGETRPFLQGARLTAWELQQDGIPVTLIADGAAGWLMSRGDIDAVIVGADRVAANGDVANKIGTYALAVLAQRHRIPFYVACPLSTIDLNITDGSKIPIEERAGDEVTGFGATRWAPQGVGACNPVFDVTPAALVAALITERGVLSTPDAPQIASLFEP